MEKITKKDLVGYMLGDLGCGLVFGLGSTYLLLFYTDVLGIAAASAATLFLIARIWDAINDPMMGSYIDFRRRTGKTKGFRSYILKGAFPLVMLAVLMFVKIPGIPQNLKLPYAYITYIGFGMLYTWVNIPYGSLVNVMTNNSEDRSKLSSFRTLGSLVGGIIMGIAAMPIITGFDNMATGFVVLASIAGVISLVSLISCSKMTKERIEIKDQSKVVFKDVFKAIINNRPYLALAIASLLGLLNTMFVLSMGTYFFLYYFKTPNLYSIFSLALVVAMMIPVLFASKLAAKFGKKQVMGFSAIGAGIVHFIIFLIPLNNPLVYIGMFFIASFIMALGSLLIYAMVADTIDYSEWKTKKRQDGVLYASYSFFRKVGQAIAGWLGGMTLVWIGFKAGADQTQVTLDSMKTIITLFPAVFSVLNGLVVLLMYNLTKEKLDKIQSDLQSRRQEEKI